MFTKMIPRWWGLYWALLYVMLRYHHICSGLNLEYGRHLCPNKCCMMDVCACILNLYFPNKISMQNALFLRFSSFFWMYAFFPLKNVCHFWCSVGGIWNLRRNYFNMLVDQIVLVVANKWLRSTRCTHFACMNEWLADWLHNQGTWTIIIIMMLLLTMMITIMVMFMITDQLFTGVC